MHLDDRDEGRGRVLFGEGARGCGGTFDVAGVADSGGGVGAESTVEGVAWGDILYCSRGLAGW